LKRLQKKKEGGDSRLEMIASPVWEERRTGGRNVFRLSAKSPGKDVEKKIFLICAAQTHSPRNGRSHGPFDGNYSAFEINLLGGLKKTVLTLSTRHGWIWDQFGTSALGGEMESLHVFPARAHFAPFHSGTNWDLVGEQNSYAGVFC